ncbi:hypothetical protein [uncultured Senegalimassilia sp.]|uniref:hypothetical protein n=1 Tax=uncultured Senegalimassilia sp. TaxID=1714350 RepID=UPI002670D928|nr:hypothetical protein [uncultured Senegalimassilia sp.]
MATVGQFFENLNECGTYFDEAEYLKLAPTQRSAKHYSKVAKPQVKGLLKRQDTTAPPTNLTHSMANIQEIELLSNNGHFSHFLNAAVVPAADEHYAPTGSNGGTEEFGLIGERRYEQDIVSPCSVPLLFFSWVGADNGVVRTAWSSQVATRTRAHKKGQTQKNSGFSPSLPLTMSCSY